MDKGGTVLDTQHANIARVILVVQVEGDECKELHTYTVVDGTKVEQATFLQTYNSSCANQILQCNSSYWGSSYHSGLDSRISGLALGVQILQ